MWIRVPRDADASTRYLERPRFAVGLFDCGPRSPSWRTENRIGGGPLVVFPSTAVEITHGGRAPVVANANVVMFYNRDQPYTRRMLDQRGDRCAHFAVPPEAFAEIGAEYDPAAAEIPGQPFPFVRGPGSPRSWLLHHALIRQLQRPEPPEELWIEESILTLLREVIGLAFQTSDRPLRGRPATDRRHRESARQLEQILSLRPEAGLSLGELAGEVGLSPFHAARVFRRHTGHSLHGYRTHLRLKASICRLADPREDLADLALSLGFANHSHYTDQFRRIFGLPPSRVQAELTAGRVRMLEREIDRRLERKAR